MKKLSITLAITLCSLIAAAQQVQQHKTVKRVSVGCTIKRNRVSFTPSQLDTLMSYSKAGYRSDIIINGRFYLLATR